MAIRTGIQCDRSVTKLMFEDAEERIKAIHKEILALVKEPSGVQVGFDSKAGFSGLVKKLKRGFFKIPVFGKKEWVRENIVSDEAMFTFMAANIELQMAYNGKLLRWSGFGDSLNPKDVPPQMADFILSRRPPIFVVIQLGVDCDQFRGLLDGI